MLQLLEIRHWLHYGKFIQDEYHLAHKIKLGYMVTRDSLLQALRHKLAKDNKSLQFK